MNKVNDVSANWEDLLRGIREHGLGRMLDLTDRKEDWYDLSNELRMRPLLERLLEALQTTWTDSTKEYEVRFGNKFFATMSEQQQRSFLRAIAALPISTLSVGDTTNNGTEKPAITIHASALLDALADLNSSVLELRLGNFALSNQSDVEELSSIILAKRETLRQIRLKGIECPIDYNKRKRDEDGPIGFLDPLLYATSHLEQFGSFELSARTHPAHSSLVSTNAVRDLFGVRSCFGSFHLHGLGLNDSHCHAIAEELRTHDDAGMLNLCLNPAISAQGYGALLGLINRSNVVRIIIVDDKPWEAKLNLVYIMNRRHGRLEYMTDGTFTSEEHRWQWLFKLASFPSSSDERDAKHVLNFIWYELLEHPEFMQT